MAAEDVTARLRATGEAGFKRAVDGAARSVRGVGDQADRVDRRARRAAGGLRVFSAATASTSRGLRATAGIVGGTGLAIGVGLVAELKRASSAWEEKRQVIQQTAAVLHSTGGAANVTERHIDSLATAISRSSGMDDEAVRGAQNLLLTFRDVRNEAGKGNNIFDQTTRVTADLAAAMGMDLNSAALQVGKALNDPERGFKRLQRIGVAFSKTQERQIKHFTKVGDRAAAQRVILRELRAEFGGSAKAQMTPLKRLEVSWGNVEEAIGEGVAPAIDDLAGRVDRFMVKAEPRLLKFGEQLRATLGNKVQTREQKFEVIKGDASEMLRPLTTAVETFWDRNQDAIITGGERAVSAAGARMADAAAAAAPHAASMFVSAFKGAGPWGQVLTVGLLASKLGVFSTLGKMAAGRMCGSITSRLPGCVDGGVKGKAGKAGWARVGTSIGRIAGPAAGVALAAYALVEFGKAVQDWTGKPGDAPPKPVRVGKHRIPTTPSTQNTQGRSLAGDVAARILGGKAKPTSDPGPSRRGGQLGPDPVIVLPRQAVRPAARAAGQTPPRPGAILRVESTVKVGQRELGRATRDVAVGDLARKGAKRGG